MSSGLPDDAERLWRDYEQAEGREHRPVMLKRLDAFVSAFAEMPADVRTEWVRSFCRRALGPDKAPIRQRLFDGVLLPVLASLFRQGDPEASLWLAALSECNVTCDRGEVERVLALPTFSRPAILQNALRANPKHEGIRAAMMKDLAYWFDHALHELPAGVLYGMDGATPEQCDELLAEIDEYCRLAPKGDPIPAEGVAWWEYHFRMYRDYLRDSQGAESYADYLDRFAGPEPPPRFRTCRYPYS